MLSDRTNSPLPIARSRAKPMNSVERMRFSMPVIEPKRMAREVDDDQELRDLKDEYATLKISDRFDSVFGNATDRATYDAHILKKVPPEQKFYGYPAEYLKQETGRLGEGFKKLRFQRDTLLRELLDIQSKQDASFEKLTTFITRMRQEKEDVQVKVAELEKRLKNEEILAEKARAAVEKEAELVARSEAACEEARGDLAKCEDEIRETRARESAAIVRIKKAEQTATNYLIQLQKVREELSELQRSAINDDLKFAEEIECEIAKWKRQEKQAHLEIQLAKSKLEEIQARLEQELQDLNNLQAENQRRESQLEAMKDRVASAEAKINEKDGSVSLALQTLRESQETKQREIAELNAEKTRLEEKVEVLLAEKKEFTDRIYEATGSLDRLRDREDQLTSRVLELEQELVSANSRLSTASDNLESARTDAAAKIAKYGEARDQVERTLEQLNNEKIKFTEFSKELSEVQSRVNKIESELAATKNALDRMSDSPKKVGKILQESKEVESLKRKVDDAEHYKQRMEQLIEELSQTKMLLFDADTQRRVLLNEVQGLKGNIQVIARIRPPLGDDRRSSFACSVDGMGLSVNLDDGQQHSFSFNRVFDAEASQLSVFGEVSQFVQSALDGYNVCLFSYGQSGSGKTWTMTGDLTNHISRGIIPRSLDNILGAIAHMREKGWEYEVQCTYLAIYNETIRDLLAEDPRLERSSRHDILNRGEGATVTVTGVRRVDIHDVEEALALLEQAEGIRSVLLTESNRGGEETGTSVHSIFTIHLTGRNPEKDGAELVGSLNFCDLAGSENGHQNSGLKALATVFSSMSSSQKATVPFRSSVLTHLLSPCLSGDGKTLMIVNLSADPQDALESLHSLKFAQQVNKTELGKAKKNIRDTAPPVQKRGRA